MVKFDLVNTSNTCSLRRHKLITLTISVSDFPLISFINQFSTYGVCFPRPNLCLVSYSLLPYENPSLKTFLVSSKLKILTKYISQNQLPCSEIIPNLYHPLTVHISKPCFALVLMCRFVPLNTSTLIVASD